MNIRTLTRVEIRPYVVLALIVAFLALADGGGGKLFDLATGFGALQAFSTFGLVALGLGVAMLAGEFDLSVAGTFGLAGCVAVLTGSEHPVLGLLCAALVGLTIGLLQGGIVTFMALGSVPVSLGGLLITTGAAAVLTESKTLSYDNIDVALALNEKIGGLLSIRSLVVMAIFVAAALFMRYTRIGRDLIATGSDRRAAQTSGVKTRSLVIGAFATSGVLSALSGALLSYGLASASAAGLADVLVPAIAAVILGGSSMSGGAGTPFGIAAGVLIITVLRSGLNALDVTPYLHEIALAAVLLFVAVLDAPLLKRRFGLFFR